MTTLLITSDLHLHPYRLCSRDGGRDRLQDGLQVLVQQFEQAQKLEATWIHCGDLKVPRTLWHQDVLNGLVEAFTTYSDVPKVLFPGNHDGPQLPSGSGLQALQHLPNVTVFEKPAITEHLAKRVGPAAILPAGATQEQIDLLLKLAQKERAEFFFGHQMLQGCRLDNNQVAPAESAASLDLRSFKASFLGDIHKGQWFHADRHKRWAWEPYSEMFQNQAQDGELGWHIKHDNKKWGGEVFYCGSPYHQDWGERHDTPKGWLVVELEAAVVHFYPAADAPAFIEIDATRAVERLAEPPPMNWEEFEGNFVRILVGTWAETTLGQKTLEFVKARSKARTLQIIPVPALQTAIRASIHAGMALPDLLSGYYDAHPPTWSNPVKAPVIKAGLQLLRGSQI